MNDKNKSPLLEITMELNSMLMTELTKFTQGDYGDVWNDKDALNVFFLRMKQVIQTAQNLSNQILQMNGAIYGSTQNLLKIIEEETTHLDKEEKTEHAILNQLKVLRKLAHEISKKPPYDDGSGELFEGICRIDNIMKAQVEEIAKVRKTAEKHLKESNRLRTDENYMTNISKQ